MATELFSALALVLVLEGILPFAMPDYWRRTMTQVARMPDRQLRAVGAVSMVAGLVLLYFIR